MSSDNIRLHISQPPTVCLSMIVKNESRIICRFLDSVRPLVDYVCICDTGSSDDTIALINKYLEENQMSGHVITKEFVDFSTNRNYALEEAKKYGDYVLLLDADMRLVNTDKFDKACLDGTGYYIKQCGGSLEYYNLRLIPSRPDSKYCGVTHEFLAFDGRKANLEHLTIDDIGDGGCKSDKFIRDERLLREGLKHEPNNARYLFYLANTLRDLGKHQEAIEYYERRVTAGGWDEEVFYSRYQIGLCYEKIGSTCEASMEKAYMDAWVSRPSRAEPLFDMARYFRLHGNNAKSWAYATVGRDIKPSGDKLFVHSDKYGTAFDRELSIVSYYVPPGVKSPNLFRRLFREDTTDLDLMNYQFYMRRFVPDNVHDFGCTYTCEIGGVPIDYKSSTPCIISNTDGYDMVIRMVSYSITSDGQYVGHESTNMVSSVYRRVGLSADLTVVWEDDGYYHMHDIQGQPKNWGGRTLHGIEDMKIFRKDRTLTAIGNTCTPDAKIGMIWGRLAHDAVYKHIDMIDDTCEKNWCVVPTVDDRFTLVYKWHPLTLIDVNTSTGQVTQTKQVNMPSIFKHVRGSTDGCVYGGHIYFLGHIVRHTKPRTYNHICVKFDMNMNYVGCSFPFKLSATPVEYCLGMVVEEDRMLFSYSENDASSKVASIRRERFFEEYWME